MLDLVAGDLEQATEEELERPEVSAGPKGGFRQDAGQRAAALGS